MPFMTPSRSVRRSFGIRSYLTLLVLVAALPFFGLIVLQSYYDAADAVQREGNTSSRIAEQTTRFVMRFLDDTRLALEAVAQKQSQLLNPAVCESTAATLASINPVYANLVVRDRADNLICAARNDTPIHAAEPDSLHRTLSEKRFIMSAPLLGPATGRWVVIARQPFRDATGEVAGTISLPLDLLNLQYLVSDAKMPPGGLIVITTNAGIVLARSLEPEKWVGKNVSGIGVVTARAERIQGQITGPGVDGIERIYGFTAIPEVGWHVASGIPTEIVYAPMRRTLILSGVLVTLIIAIVTALVIAITRRIARPIGNLSEAANAIVSGRMDVRSEVGGPDEVIRMSNAFNTMLDALLRGNIALRDNETRLKLAMHAGRIGLHIWNHATKELYISPEWKRLLGYDDHQIANSTEAWLAFVHPDDRPGVVAEMKLYFADLQPGHEIEFRLRHRSGDYCWVLARIDQVCDTDRQPQQSIACYVDITERKRAEQALRKSEADYQDLYENAPDMYLSVDSMSGRVLQCNQATVNATGYAKDEIVGRHVFDMYHPECLAAVRKAFAQFLLTGAVRDVTLQVHRKGGGRIDISLSATAVRDAAGKVLYSRSIWRDITARIKVQQAQSQLSAIVTTSNDAIISRAPDDTIVSWNAAAGRMFGWTAQEAIGKSFRGLLSQTPDEKRLRRFEKILREENTAPLEDTRLRKDGSSIRVQTTMSAVKNERGDIMFVSCIMRDITERKHAEAALRVYAERMQELSKRLMESEEAERRNISRELHDSIGQNLSALNLQLGIVRARLAKDPPQAADARLDDAQKLIETTTRQVRNIMAELRPAELDDYGLLAALRSYCASFAKRFELPITVTCEDIPPRLAPGTEVALFRIAQEGLNNIVKHARATQVEVSLAVMRERVRLTVADDGVGFDGARRSAPGAGLGMTTMRERAEAVGAALRVESAPGHGTRVVVEAVRDGA